MKDAPLDFTERVCPASEVLPAILQEPDRTPRPSVRVRVALGGFLIVCGLILAEGWLRAANRSFVRLGHEADQPSISEAKEALLALIRSGGARDLRISPDELSRRPQWPRGAAGAWSWGPFKIDLPGKTYGYTLFYSPKCALEISGRFERGQGRWVAIPYEPPWN
jgi:hypothetical protein